MHHGCSASQLLWFRILQEMREFRPDVIIALGGGSPMDAAKVMWLM